ncbi:hypothetical protein ACJBPP_11410, partial [Streptococcus suis]
SLREVTTKYFDIAIISDELPPALYRVKNIVNQIDKFYTDLNVKVGVLMYVKRVVRLRVWFLILELSAVNIWV